MENPNAGKSSPLSSTIVWLVAVIGFVWVIYTPLLVPLVSRLDQTFSAIFGPNLAQQTLLTAFKADYVSLLKKTCDDKTICEKYESVKDSCAVATDTNSCIGIRMSGKDYSLCENMKLFSASPYLFKDLIPSKEQCWALNNMPSVLSRYSHRS